MAPHKFKAWFDSRLRVGCLPQNAKGWNSSDYDCIINVSDEHYPLLGIISSKQQYYWFPMSEQKKDMGLNSIYGAIIVLCTAEVIGGSVYLHCHSGSNRSWTVACAYYYFRTGEHLLKPDRSGKYENMQGIYPRKLKWRVS